MKTDLKISKSYTIKELPITERPREKLYNYGPETLSNEELIAIIIRTGNRTESAVELGKKVLSKDNRGLVYLRDTTLQELMEIKGIGECKAAQILAAIELGKRINYFDALEKVKINQPSTIASLFMDEMRYLQKEHFRILLNGINNNAQCYRRNRAKNDNTEIITFAKSHFESNFKIEEEYINIEYYVEE